MPIRLVLVLATVFSLIACSNEAELTPAPKTSATNVVAPEATKYVDYTVVKGDFIVKIALDQGVGYEQVMLANEQMLKGAYPEICSVYSEKYRNRTRGNGHFCRDNLSDSWANTLVPGQVLKIPVAMPKVEVPEEVSKIVETIPNGKRVAIVIDDTGSMDDDQRIVGELWAGSLKAYGKSLVGVCLYADDEVRCYSNNVPEFYVRGDKENTFDALKKASDKTSADIIVLVTDEPGDDWEWNNWVADDVSNLPPVMAHCLNFSCEENLNRVAKITGGKYIGPMYR